ncbi:hypothetical protein TcCL_Unassigned02997 [Trypanosoma cruzi]|nr:hypothetical protein TcCL_Unassigned02997 [Trypanosoma cruzi]
MQRERADKMRKGQQAQPHSSHTTRRHPPPSPPSSFLLSQRNGKSTAATTQRTRSKHPPHEAEAEAKPHPSMTWQQNYLPSRPQWDTEPNSTQSHAVHHTRRKIDSGCALPLLPSPHAHGGRQQPPHATASMHHKRSIQIHCNVHPVCVCLQNHKEKKKRGSRVCGETHKNVQRRRMAETTTRRPLKLMTVLQPGLQQFTQDLLKTKKERPPSSYTNPITQNNYK